VQDLGFHSGEGSYYGFLCYAITHNMMNRYTKSSNALHRKSEDCKRNSAVLVIGVKFLVKKDH
jgi:hypothetical protein